jgi:multiple sugar transport system substrate-binding protein
LSRLLCPLDHNLTHMKSSRLLVSLLLLVAAGCSGLNLPGDSTPTSQPAVSPSPTPIPTETLTPTPSNPETLTLWLPPEFDPQGGSSAARILQERLDEFSQRREVRIEVRIKAASGPGGLLDSLTTANAAAPLALPDLVALPHPTLETAALKGLLHPYDELSNLIEDADWYDYARQLARLQNSNFGLPFAGDALLLVHRTTVIEEPPTDLESALDTQDILAFAGADPQAIFTLAQYMAAGGPVLDEQEHPYLDLNTLTSVLAFIQQAENSGLMPFWITQFQTNEQAWQAFEDGRANMVVTWASRHFENMLADTAGSRLPTLGSEPFTLATGWVWALASPNPENLPMSVELAEFLSQSDFLARWNEAAGLLPTRPSTLSNWRNTSQQSLVGGIAQSAHLTPSSDVMTSLAPPLADATLQVLKQQADPPTAAQDAVQSLSGQQ